MPRGGKAAAEQVADAALLRGHRVNGCQLKLSPDLVCGLAGRGKAVGRLDERRSGGLRVTRRHPQRRLGHAQLGGGAGAPGGRFLPAGGLQQAEGVGHQPDLSQGFGPHRDGLNDLGWVSRRDDDGLSGLQDIGGTAGQVGGAQPRHRPGSGYARHSEGTLLHHDHPTDPVAVAA